MSQKIFLRHTRNLHLENEQLKMGFLVHKSRFSKNLKKLFLNTFFGSKKASRRHVDRSTQSVRSGDIPLLLTVPNL